MARELLTPAEAVFLLAPKTGTAIECLQAALLSLLSTGRIAIEGRDDSLQPLAIRLNATDRLARVPLPDHLAAIERTLREYGTGDRRARSQVLRALQKRFGYGYGRYVHDHIGPELIARGLLLRNETKVFGLFRRVRYRRTAQGEAMMAPLQRVMTAVEQMPSLIDTDPDAALRIARSAGVLLVMSAQARARISELRALLAQRGDDGSFLALPTDATSALAPGDMALTFDLDSLFSGLSAVADLTSDGDSGTDGGDGGDAGGGDGGGGGGLSASNFQSVAD